MKIGIIGTGNMGTIILEAFIESLAVAPSNLIITNRTIQKAYTLQQAYPDIQVVASPKEVAQLADIIFVCTKPLDINPLLASIAEELVPEKTIVSITSPISVEQLESAVNCQVVRAIPSITNRALAGVSLLTFGNRCKQQTKDYVNGLFSQISTTIEIENDITRVSSDIVSCGPAFISFILQDFIRAAVAETKISTETATSLVSGMMIGFGKLLEKEVFTLSTLQEKVCVKGGITGEGIKVLEQELGPVFNHLFQATHRKYREDLNEVSHQFQPYED
ncbi:late competence protein ComER [Bacillus sp. HMF5848]|uniref:late competence protein ComER n=1 Tax=Bacillus sp. HMF5848 TaxID=2495421 RepID=UPI000F79DD2E|nr:late competence protein ComER [Bacillus sp. HMF5848]RSK27917.1 late competence protein ComER [Bacillus sp. HMF5848]